MGVIHCTDRPEVRDAIRRLAEAIEGKWASDRDVRWVAPCVTGLRYGGVMSSTLDLDGLKAAAAEFAESLRGRPIPELFGATDGKALGTWIETSFNEFIAERYSYDPGNPARGIDFPELKVDLKATFVKQPQSSCPFRDASQKVFGLGYDLLVFVYEKTDTHEAQSAAIDVRHALFIDRSRTGDYQTTRGIREILDRGGNAEDLVAFMEDRNLPLDEVGRTDLAERVLSGPPEQGYVTISNALQWRLQYGHAIANAGGRGCPRPRPVRNSATSRRLENSQSSALRSSRRSSVERAGYWNRHAVRGASCSLRPLS